MSTATDSHLDFTIKPYVSPYKANGKSTIVRSAVVEGKLTFSSDEDDELLAGKAAEGLRHAVRYAFASMNRMSRELMLDTEEDGKSFQEFLGRVGLTLKTMYDRAGLPTTFTVADCERVSELPTAGPDQPCEKQADGTFEFGFVVTSDAADSSALRSLEDMFPKLCFRDESEDSLCYTEDWGAWHRRAPNTLGDIEQLGAMTAKVAEESLIKNITPSEYPRYIIPLINVASQLGNLSSKT